MKQNNIKKIDDDFMSTNCNVIVIFPSYGQFKAIWKPDCRCIVCNAYLFINSNLLFYKNLEIDLKSPFHTALTLLLWANILFLPKKCWFFVKNADISKIKKVLVLKGTFYKNTYVYVLTCVGTIISKIKYDNEVQLSYIDTNCFIINIKSNDFYQDSSKDVEEWFDTSNYEVKRALPRNKDKKKSLVW